MKLQIGKSLPDFKLPDQNGLLVNIKDFIGKPLVIFFYPKDNTPVCTIEACTFEANYNEFKDLKAEIFGISSDSVKSHKNFAEKNGLTFSLLSDTKNEVEKQFGVERNLFGLLQQRVTFIFDEKGLLIHVFQSQLNGKKHIAEALSALKSDH